MAYPEKLLDNIYWNFNTSQMDPERFNNALTEYNEYLGNKIDTFEIALNTHKIIILYSQDENSLIFELDSDSFFNCGELLYKIQEKTHSFIKNSDYVFFEGLEIDETKTLESKIPTYRLILGS